MTTHAKQDQQNTRNAMLHATSVPSKIEAGVAELSQLKETNEMTPNELVTPLLDETMGVVKGKLSLVEKHPQPLGVPCTWKKN